METFASRTRAEPEPITPGAVTTVKSALYPVPPSVTVISVTALPDTTIFTFNPVPVPPKSSTSKY